ncbi:hypothetical protein QFC21_005218 [Naganishia friedmannii]|uniref:Uncharacterized protein n=1 Tax=Naganishia friedmannii TaxID=89922 RepID=A0ACC2VBE5_9TREE|nr:hypothetical protein QFC21_005218 [Naganishia friedmannii]
MNFSFLALVVTLLTMAYLTSFNKHVVFLMVVSTGLWVTMIWFVTEISQVQTQPQNAPQAAPPYEGPVPATSTSATASADVEKPDLLPPSSSSSSSTKSTAREHVQTPPQKRTR